MCEYCGCQEIPAIAQLTAEHDEIVNLMGEVRADLHSGRLDSAAQRCRRMLAVLGPHTRVEEHGLFPPMRAEFPDQVDGLQAEHRSIEATLGEAAAATPADASWPSRLLRTLEELRDHILKEQDGVFPASLAVLKPEDWDLIEALQADSPLRRSDEASD